MNNQNLEKPKPRDGDAGQAQMGKTVVLHPHYTKNPLRLQHASDTTLPDGPPILWAAVDAIFTLRDELEKIGLECPDSAIQSAWDKMRTASYMPVEVAGDD